MSLATLSGQARVLLVDVRLPEEFTVCRNKGAEGTTRFSQPADQDSVKRSTDPKRARFEPRK